MAELTATFKRTTPKVIETNNAVQNTGKHIITEKLDLNTMRRSAEQEETKQNETQKDNTFYYEYEPVLKSGTMYTYITPVGESEAAQYKYTGEYLEFESNLGYTVRAPLEVLKSDEMGNIIQTEMTEEEKKAYTERVTQYCNHIFYYYKQMGTEKYKKEINERLDNVNIIYLDTENSENIDSAYASAYDMHLFPGNRDAVVLYGHQIINFEDPEDYYNSDEALSDQIFSFFHELGHVYANNKIIGKDRDETEEWIDIYNQVIAKEDRELYFREYAFSSNKELFADTCECYYRDPNNLKMVEIESGEYDNLYDYMNDIMGGKK